MAENNSIPSSQESLLFSQETLNYLQDQFDCKDTDLASIMNDVTVTDEVHANIPVSIMGNSNDFILSSVNSCHMITAELNIERAFPNTLASTAGLNIEKAFPNMVTNTDGLAQHGAFLNIEQINTYQIYDPVQAKPPSILPACESWEGEYSFKVSFNLQGAGDKWTWAEKSNKLYIAKDVACPLNFSTSRRVPDGATIRVMALFKSPENALDPVKRCINHSQNEIEKGIPYARHLIRCDSKSAIYEVDACTKRLSVVVPYENPAVGQTFSTYLFKFCCFSSCSGGPNRRAMMAIITLEMNGKVIGRQKIDFKVCACPSRDSRKEGLESSCDTQKEEPENFNLSSETVSKNNSKLAVDALDSNLPNYSKKLRKSDSKDEDGYYVIKVKDKKCYEFLKSVRKYYGIYTMINKKRPHDYKCLIYSSSSDEVEKLKK